MGNPVYAALLLVDDGNNQDQQVQIGGLYAFVSSGYSGGVEIQGPDGSTWVLVPDSELNGDGAVGVYLPTGAKVRGSDPGSAGQYASLSLVG